MRLWTLHPKYLDPQGLVALWREGLLARAVLRGETRGYHHHPQLDRFRSLTDPQSRINAYLAMVFEESLTRGYSFDGNKIGQIGNEEHIEVTSGQVEFEWQHLMQKLSARSPLIYSRWHQVAEPELHTLFHIVPGEIESWERGQHNGK